MLNELIKKNRSYRRFNENVLISEGTLFELIELARFSASGANRQPLKYLTSSNTEKNALIFPELRWAGYLSDWPGPGKGERPSAYIIILGDTRITRQFGCDHGIAAQSILLGAVEKGYGGCMIGAFNKGNLKDKLNLPEYMDILLIIALGKPVEEVILEDLKEGNGIEYYRTPDGKHHVPKRSLDELIIRE